MLTDQTISSSQSLSASTGDAGDLASASSEGCPTPLDWRQVVTSFREERKRRSILTSRGPIETVRFGEGPPLYLLNGFLGDHELFALLAWILREEQTTVIIDWPADEGRTRRNPQAKLRELAAQVVEVADADGHDQFSVHASSFGCLVTLQALLDFPNRITRASLQGAFAARKFSLVERGLLIAAGHSRQTLGYYRPARSVQRQNHRQWFPPFDGTRWEFYEQLVGQTPLRELARRATLADCVDLSERLSEITPPLLFITCEGDGRLSITAQHEVARRTPNSRIGSLDNCGSIPHVTHPHRLAKLLRQFRDGDSHRTSDISTTE